MLPIVDKPIIQYAVDEAVNAGINEIIFIVSPSKSSIKEYFDKSENLERLLQEKEKTRELLLIRSILPKDIKCTYVIQNEALGLGHAILCARDVVGDEPFSIILPDDLIRDKNRGCLYEMVRRYNENNGSIIAVENIPRENTNRYGIVSIRAGSGNPYRITDIVEKPNSAEAPSTLGVVGRYILQPEIFRLLERTEKGHGGEIQLTDAIKMLLDKDAVYAYEFAGKRFDCGSKLGLLEANVLYALEHDELSGEFSEFLKTLVTS